MESLNHLKNYRSRYCDTDDQRQAIDIQQGENVLKYVEDCFETFAREFEVYSPSTSCCSSPDLNKIQVPSDSKEQEQQDPDKINYVKNAFNTFTFSPLGDSEVRSSGANVLKDDETIKSHSTNIQSDTLSCVQGEEVMSLGSPALLVEEEQKSLRCQCLRSLMLPSSPPRSTNSIEPVNESEFLIEESFGEVSADWYSRSQKNKKAKKNSLKGKEEQKGKEQQMAASSEEKQVAKQQSIKRNYKRASKKTAVAVTPVKQTPVKLTDLAERPVDGLQNASRATKTMMVVNDQLQLVTSTIGQATKKRHSKVKPSVEIQESTREDVHLEDQVALLEEDHNFSVEPQTVVSTTQQSSHSNQAVEMDNEGCQDSTSTRMHSEDQVSVQVCSCSVSKMPLCVSSTAHPLDCRKNVMKQTCSKMTPSLETHNRDCLEYATANVSSKCQETKGTNVSSRGQLLPQQFTILSSQQSSHAKSVKKQNPQRTAPSENQLKTQMNDAKSVRASRRKNKVLQKRSETEHREEQCDEWAKSCHEQTKLTELKKTAPRISPKVKRTFSLSLEDDDDGSTSHQKKSCERLNLNEEAVDTELQNSRDVKNSEGYYARKETQELFVGGPKCFTNFSSLKKKPEPLEQLETMPRSSTQRCLRSLMLPSSPPRSTNSIEPVNESEFLIEESFGEVSADWYSRSQKNKKAKKNSLIVASSEEKQVAKQQSIKRNCKRASKKTAVAEAPVKQTPVKLTDLAERPVDGLQNASRATKTMMVVNDQLQLVTSTIGQATKKRHSKVKPSVEIQESTREDVHLEDQVALLEEDHNFSVEPQTVVSTTQQSSHSNQAVEMGNEGCQDSTSTRMHSEDQVSVQVCSCSVSKMPLCVSSTAHPLDCRKNVMKQTCSKMTPSLETHNRDCLEYATANVSSKCQETKGTNVSSRGQLLPQQFTILSAQQSSHAKSVKKQNPQRTAPSENQLKTQMNDAKSVRASRRKNKVLEKRSETEHREEQCDEWAKSCHEQTKLTELKKTAPRISPKVKRTFSVSLEDDDDGSTSHQKKSCERCSCALDVNVNEISGPVFSPNCKTSSKPENFFNMETSTSDKSVDLDLGMFITQSLKHKLVIPTNTPNVRRTKRMRLKPLEYWRGERVNYKMGPSGDVVVGGIISPEQEEPSKLKRKAQPFLESENIMDNKAVSINDPSQPAIVFDTVSNETVLLECVKNGSSHVLFFSNEVVSIYKYLTTPFFSAGKMIIKPLKEKGFQYTFTDTMVFHICCGTVLLTLYHQCYYLTDGDYFYIPAGNIYNIRNLLDKVCILIFTQLKGNRSEEE